MASAPCNRGGVGPRHRAQIAADVSGRQADAAQPGNHDVREILAHAAAQRERHRRHGGDGGRADLVGDVGFQPADQLDRRVEHGSAGRENSRAYNRGSRGSSDTMRLGNRKCAGEQRPDVARRKGLVAHRFPGRRRAAPRSAGASTATRAANLTVSVSCGSSISIQVKPVAEEILPFAPVHGFGHDLQARRHARAAGARLIGVSRSTWRACATGDA